jgi:hypothetical protein
LFDVPGCRGDALLPQHVKHFERCANMLDTADRIGEPFHLDQLIDGQSAV